MKLLKIRYYIKESNFSVIVLLLFFAFSFLTLQAQTHNQLSIPDASQTIDANGLTDKVDDKNFAVNKDFRVEKLPIEGGAELITIFANLKDLSNSSDKIEEVPLVSILRDTLGDNKIENDQFRYVWMLTYTKPTLMQKFAAVVPFFYLRTTNKEKIGNAPPPPIIDLNPAKKEIWNKFFGLFLEILSWKI